MYGNCTEIVKIDFENMEKQLLSHLHSIKNNSIDITIYVEGCLALLNFSKKELGGTIDHNYEKHISLLMKLLFLNRKILKSGISSCTGNCAFFLYFL